MIRRLAFFLGLLLASVTFAQAKTPVPAPLTGTITLNSWTTYNQSFPGIRLACGKPFHFNVVTSPQYDPTSYVYPLYIWLHPDHQGDPWYYGGNTQVNFLANDEGGSYNTVAWMTRYPGIYVLPYADQTNGNGTTGSCTNQGNSAVENWGGWFNNGTVGSGTNYSGDTGPNTFALLQMVTFLENNYSIDTSRIIVNGFSLGAIGSGYLCQHYNAYNGNPAIFSACLESGGGVDNADQPVTSADTAIMNKVPTWYFSGANDGSSPPGNYNTPLCTQLGGNPANLTAITSASANRCGSSQMRYTLCPTCGHQNTDANGNPVWTNTIMNDFAFSVSANNQTAQTASRTYDFLNMISVQGCLTGGGAAPCLANNGLQEVADIQYLGALHYRTGFDVDLTPGSNSLKAFTALLNAGISTITGPPYPSSITPSPLTTTTPANQIAQAHAWQAINPNAIAFMGGINEPGLTFPTAVYGTHGVTASNCTGSGGGGGGGCTWQPVIEYERDYMTALLADNALKNIPIFAVSRAGEEPSNIGAQFLTIPATGSYGLPAGTVLGQVIDNHVYPTDQGQYYYTTAGTDPAYPANTSAKAACQPNDPVAGNAFNIQTHFDQVATFNGTFAGYASDAIAQALPRAVTEFGYPTLNPGPSANGDRLNEDKKGRCILNGLLTAFGMGMKVVNIYSLYSGVGDPGFGLMSGAGSPNLSGQYLHNLTAVMTDTGSTAKTFTPGSLTYSLSNMPAAAATKLFQKSNGHYQLVIWNNATNWNIATGAPITVAPVNVGVQLTAGTNYSLTAYDSVSGTSPTQTLTGNAITVAVADYPVIVDIAPANTTAETITVNAIATQTATVPFVVSGSIANANSVPTLEYSINNGVWTAVPTTAAGTRDPYKQPGSNKSVWNTPFGTSATWSNQYNANICNVQANLSQACYGNINTVTNFGRTEYTSTSTSDPTFTFTATLNGRTIAPDNGSTLTATMHVPTGAYTSGPYSTGCDCSFILQDENGQPNRQYTWGRIGTTGIAPPGLQSGQGPFTANEGGEWDDITSDLYGQDYDSGLSGFNVGAGLINACDVTPSCNPFYPQIKHGLRVDIDGRQVASNAIPGSNSVLNPSGWPDRLEDTQTAPNIYTGVIPFGTTLGIPMSTAMPTGLDANCQGLFWTMQHYPLIMRDTNTGGFNLTTEQIGDSSAYIASARACLPQLVGLLQALTNQHQGGQSFTTQPANGPGARVDTGPYPLSGGTGGGTVTLTSFNFTVPGQAGNSSNTISIRDANQTSVVGTSNTFIINSNGGGLTGTPQSPLPSGYLHTSGNQVLDGSNNPVRLSCEGYITGNTGTYSNDMAKMRLQGFNCVRVNWYDATDCPNGTCIFNTTTPSGVSWDALVSAAGANNMKVIINHHGNEGVGGGTGECHAYQANGLWYDVPSSTPVSGITWNVPDGTDGCGTTGTVTYARYRSNWIQWANHYKGNTTVIGFDLHNEPNADARNDTLAGNWGGNNGGDNLAMNNDVGAALEAADPGVLIIVEGIITPRTFNLCNGTSLSSLGATSGSYADLSCVTSKPITCCAGEVVYSIHDYPNSVSGFAPDSGAAITTIRNNAWGYIVKNNIGPFYIGEMGANLDNSDGQLAAQQAWITSLTQYLNGQLGASGGPTFSGCNQPIGIDWYQFGYNPGGQIDGTLNSDGTNKAGQLAAYQQLQYTTCSGGGNNPPPPSATTWNPADISGLTLTNSNLTATSNAAGGETVRSTTSQSGPAKVCFEVTATTITPNWDVGISNSSFPLTSGLGADSNGIGFDPNSTGGAQGIFFNNARPSSGSSTSSNGEKATICVDLGASLFWATSGTMRGGGNPWNNSASANPATGTGGISFSGLACPCFATFNEDEANGVGVLNATGPFAVATPSGFSPWQAAVASGGHPIVINLGN